MPEENGERKQEAREGQLKEDGKVYSISTWFLLVGSLVVFFIMSVMLAEYLNNFAPWRPAVPIIIGFAAFFLIIGVFLRTKFGRLAL